MNNVIELSGGDVLILDGVVASIRKGSHPLRDTIKDIEMSVRRRIPILNFFVLKYYNNRISFNRVRIPDKSHYIDSAKPVIRFYKNTKLESVATCYIDKKTYDYIIREYNLRLLNI